MRRLLNIASVLFLSLYAHASNVVWDSLDVWRANDCYLESDLGYPRLLSIGLTKTCLGNDCYSYQANIFNLLFAGNWIQASVDDVVNCGSFANNVTDLAYTECCEGSFIVSSGTPADACAGDVLYLAFKCGILNESLEVTDPVYGWVSFDVGLDGSLEYAHSAWDLDGGAMMVGGGSAVPEPSASLLLLLGCAGLLLRRGKRREYLLARRSFVYNVKEIKANEIVVHQ